jgi:hypothetical protein
LFERFPARDGTFCGLDRNLPERTCRNSCCVGKAPHLVGCDSVKPAAAAEVQGKRVSGNVGESCHKIVGRRQNGCAPVGVQERPVFELRKVSLNDRQTKVLNKLFSGFEGKLTREKWMKMTKVSSRTALRNIEELIALGVIEREEAGGRSTSYRLEKGQSDKVLEN